MLYDPENSRDFYLRSQTEIFIEDDIQTPGFTLPEWDQIVHAPDNSVLLLGGLGTPDNVHLVLQEIAD